MKAITSFYVVVLVLALLAKVASKYPNKSPDRTIVWLKRQTWVLWAGSIAGYIIAMYFLG